MGHEGIADEDRLSILELEIIFELAHAVRFKLDQHELCAGSPRLKWLYDEAEAILRADNPMAQVNAVLERPPTPPADLDAGPVLVAQGIELLPGDDGYAGGLGQSDP